jgi:hypothetical protein
MRIAVDAEHSGLRLVVTLMLFVAAAVAFVFINLALPSLGWLISLVISVIFGYGLAAGLERQLKRRWPSGRAIEIGASGVRLLRREVLEQAVDSARPSELLCWRFEVRGRGRVPKGWWMVACGLAQGDALIAAYTFMSPQRLETLPGRERFTQLTAPKASLPESGADLRLAGEQKRLKDAEYRRWQDGAEMTNSDFERYLEAVLPVFGR